MNNKIIVKQIKSSIKKTEVLKLSLKGLGLKKIGDEKLLENTPSVRGMIKKVIHLVEVKDA